MTVDRTRHHQPRAQQFDLGCGRGLVVEHGSGLAQDVLRLALPLFLDMQHQAGLIDRFREERIERTGQYHGKRNPQYQPAEFGQRLHISAQIGIAVIRQKDRRFALIGELGRRGGHQEQVSLSLGQALRIGPATAALPPWLAGDSHDGSRAYTARRIAA